MHNPAKTDTNMESTPFPQQYLRTVNEKIMLKTDAAQSTSHFSNVLLTGTILLANVDVTGLMDYSLKALLGGAIWLGYKITADYLDRKRKDKK